MSDSLLDELFLKASIKRSVLQYGETKQQVERTAAKERYHGKQITWLEAKIENTQRLHSLFLNRARTS